MTAWFRKEDARVAARSPSIDPVVAAGMLRAFIAARSKLVTESELSSDTALFSSGILDSLAFVELVLFVEKEFHVKLADVTDVNMDSLDSIENIVYHIGKSAGGA